LLGEHTDDVLTEWLRLSQTAIRSLRDDGIV
jgi:crotonobetainyl-CoA:carnitine CoA-transferase CaiB-like acyl-CoA transferase